MSDRFRPAAGRISSFMDEPVAIDGSEGPLVVRRVVAWRRLEPGDERTPGTELAPESTHLEAKVVQVGISESLRDELVRLWSRREELAAVRHRWTARYEPAGILFALGGGVAVGTLGLQHLPSWLLPHALGLMALGVAVGVFTRANKRKYDGEVTRRWRESAEREELEKLQEKLLPRWERFSEKLRVEHGFRTEVRIGEFHEVDRLVSIDVSRISHPNTWKPDETEGEVRYGWRYADGRVVEQIAELEETEGSVPKIPSRDP